MGRVPDDGEAPAADHRRTMVTPKVTEIKRGSAHGRASDTTMTALLLEINTALTPAVVDAGYELVQISERGRQAIRDVLGPRR
jgi:hypothetical protein